MRSLLSWLTPAPAFVKNKFFIAGLAAIMWLFFFDGNNLFNQFEITMEYQRLLDRKAYLEEEIEKDRARIQALKGDPKELERYAREQYFMKKEGETIIRILPEKDTQTN